jgi:mannose/cellobiose epimerase-like protein (N-acyl-D-glucosamine 2-epimerase family)
MSTPAPTGGNNTAERMRIWLVEAALPLWLSRGIDRANGGFEESLGFDGRRIAGQDKRIRVQARQIYVASHAAVLNLREGAFEAARFGYEFLTGSGWHPDGGWVHVLSETGEIRDPKRDTYDHAFVLLALAWYYRATRDPTALTWIERTVAALDSVLGDGSGAYFESYPRSAPRRQNPHMHCFEAMLALFEATNEQMFADRAKRLRALVCERLFDSKSGALREFYGDDWKPLASPLGDIVEPGHHCEWVWLLDKFERLTSVDTAPERRALLEFAMKHGRHPVSGLLVDRVRTDGTVDALSQRLWPQTEAIKALLTRVERGDTSSWSAIDQFASALLERYLPTDPWGLWRDHFGADSILLSKAVPASSLYHLFVAISELLRVAASHPRR